MENCIFCKIVSGDIPSSKVYEDDDVLAFLDISQATNGHTLVIPKKHVRNVLEMDEATAETVFSRVPKLARAIKKATGAQGLNIINNNEEAAGQTVFHAHIHLLPRYQEGDEFNFQFVQHEPDFAKLAELATTIQKEVNE
ncbi:HIT family protein [Streptococcus zalophi]|uniref:HIT family protein n=1 Tax=Streptococcus zalophi TaxID=640031 RepID=A0A934P8W3_9STRE|nr:HIT family protein [Streptococcus zalophi]MBJ8349254.1 HIT family protein [Streptococcus zalophi]MCR8967124.1 HIT family protein [Streptococcus zalophi]